MLAFLLTQDGAIGVQSIKVATVTILTGLIPGKCFRVMAGFGGGVGGMSLMEG